METSKAHRIKMISAVVANQRGEIFDLPGYGAVGMAGDQFQPLGVADTVSLPHGSEMMFLPDRRPVLYNFETAAFEVVAENPFVPGEPLFPVAAFNSPGYVVSRVVAYQENQNATGLPLFSYGALGWARGKFRSAAILVDREKRQDLRYMKHRDIVNGIKAMRRKLPRNRLRQHLEKCALTYGCPAGKNFFLRRFEAPLPTATACNARCLGCISLQSNSDIPNSQDRIDFTPNAKEISQVAIAHIQGVKNAVVSFGQGCEGDPLTAAAVIEPAISRIRVATDRGTINMNCNGSKPKTLKRLLAAGLDSMRVSLNSVREACYDTYFRPRGYGFKDVLASIDLALRHDRFVSINYLNMPGFTDTTEEAEALAEFLREHPIHMIQWRNLNFDPLRYYRVMQRAEEPVSVQTTPCNEKSPSMPGLLRRIRREFPKLKFGYFNPPKEKFKIP